MKRPNSRRNLDRAIERLFGDDPGYIVARTIMADAIVAQMLPDGVIKGGSRYSRSRPALWPWQSHRAAPPLSRRSSPYSPPELQTPRCAHRAPLIALRSGFLRSCSRRASRAGHFLLALSASLLLFLLLWLAPRPP